MPDNLKKMNRWENLLKDHVAKAKQPDLDTDFTEAIFELIHTQAVTRQFTP